MQDAGDQDQRADDPHGGGLRGRLERLLGGRPLSVYGVLIAGIGVLALLLAIVVITGRGDGAGDETPICLPIDRDKAFDAIDAGTVERMNVVREQDRPEVGPIAVTLDLNDGDCRRLPEGVASQRDLYEIIGVVTVFNESREGEQRIRVRWAEQSIPAELRATATPTPTVTPPPTYTPVPTPTPLPTNTPPPTATIVPPTPSPAPPTATATAAAPTETVAAPAAIPAASPTAAGTAATPTVAAP